MSKQECCGQEMELDHRLNVWQCRHRGHHQRPLNPVEQFYAALCDEVIAEMLYGASSGEQRSAKEQVHEAAKNMADMILRELDEG